MARNGKNAAATATEPNDFYDKLDQFEQDLHDRIGARGYRITFESDSCTFEAAKGLTRVTANTLVELLEGVKAAEGEIDEEFDNQVDDSDDTETVVAGDDAEAEPHDGFLFKEMKPKRQVVIPELRQPILNYEAYKEERIQVLAKEVEAKKQVDELLHAHKENLAFDPKSGVYSYRVNDVIVELIPGEDKLKSRRATDDDEE